MIPVGQTVTFNHRGRTITATVQECKRKRARIRITSDPDGSLQVGKDYMIDMNRICVTNGKVVAPPGTHVPPMQKPKIFHHGPEAHVMFAIISCYNGLSPENLTGDGERPLMQQRALRQEYQRILKGCFAALGQEVTEEEAYKWMDEHKKDPLAAQMSDLE